MNENRGLSNLHQPLAHNPTILYRVLSFLTALFFILWTLWGQGHILCDLLFETGSHVPQADLKLKHVTEDDDLDFCIFLLPPPKHWNYGYAPSYTFLRGKYNCASREALMSFHFLLPSSITGTCALGPPSSRRTWSPVRGWLPGLLSVEWGPFVCGLSCTGSTLRPS